MKAAFDTPIVYLITKGEATADNFAEKRRDILDVVRAAVDAGVTFVQLREKKLPARLVYELAADIARLTRGSSTRLLVNDRADIALAAGCDGVQLTSRSLAADIVRKMMPEEFIIGVSTHSIDEVRKAETDGADFAVFGPIFETPGKGNVQGLDALKQACEAVRPFPMIAIGGIDADNYTSVLCAGAAGFAAIRALNDVAQLNAMARTFRNN